MKKLFVSFIGADEYEDITGGSRYPKWDFKVNPILECILMDRKTLPNKNGNGTYDLYTVIEKTAGTPHVVFCAKVLEDKLKNLPLHSCVRVKFTGKHPTKNYFMFEVGFNKAFKFDPNVYSLDKYEDAGGTSEQSTNQNAGAQQGNVSTPAAQTFEDDLPF
jgi:hypothetical protein